VSDLLKHFDNPITGWLWLTAIGITAISLLISLYMGVRRIWRNRKKPNAHRIGKRFEDYLTLGLSQDIDPNALKKFAYSKRHVPAMIDVLLHYFRTLDGSSADVLRTITARLGLEAHIIKRSQNGTLGRQMSAIQTLSYLQTQKSLAVIHKRLTAKNKYVRVTAARCLARQKADAYVPDIIHAVSAAFPKNSPVLSEILYQFGKPITPVLEGYIETSDNDVLRAACIDAIIMLMPPKTTLNLDALMQSSSADLRASTVELSQITEHNAQTDFLSAGLKDSSTAGKIRSAKLAYAARRVDTLTHLHALTQDPVIWVRYWAMRAIWACGAQGQKLVETIGRGDDVAGHMARDVALECASDFSHVQGGAT